MSPVPPGYMQAQHIRGFSDYAAKGLDYSRLMIASYDSPGRVRRAHDDLRHQCPCAPA